MASLKKLLRRAAELTHLPVPLATPADHPLAEPLDLVREYVKAWDAHDAEGIARLFVEDADFVNVVGLWWTGRRSIVRAQKFGFTHAFANAKISVQQVSQRMLGDDAAVVMAKWQITGQVDPAGDPVDPRRGILSATLVKLTDGSWIGVNCTNTDIALAADTNVSKSGNLAPTSYIKAPTAEEFATIDRDEQHGYY